MLIILLGESCVGKSTLENKLTELSEVNSVEIYTIREHRGVEDNSISLTPHGFGVKAPLFDFVFESNEETLYGYKFPNTKHCVVSIISGDVAISLKELYSGDTHIIKLIADPKDIYRCLKNRGYDDERIKLRQNIKSEVENQLHIHRDDAYSYIKGLLWK